MFSFLKSLSKYTLVMALCSAAYAELTIDVNSNVFFANEATQDSVTYNIRVPGDVIFVGTMSVDGTILFDDPDQLNPTIYLSNQLSITGFLESAPESIEVLEVGGVVVQTAINARRAIPQFGFFTNVEGGDVIIEHDIDLPGSIDLSANGGRTIIAPGVTVSTPGNFQINGVIGFNLEAGATINAERGVFVVQQNRVPDVYSLLDGNIVSGSSITIFSSSSPFPGRIFVNGELSAARRVDFASNQTFVNGSIRADRDTGVININTLGNDELTRLNGNAELSAQRVCIAGTLEDLGAVIDSDLGCF